MDSVENPLRGRPASSRSVMLRYGCAVVSIALVTWVRLLLDPMLGNGAPFATLFFAILLTAWYGGLWPAIAALVLGVVSADYFLIEPRGSFGFYGAAEYVELALYLIAGTGIAVLGGLMQSTAVRNTRTLRQTREALAPQSDERLRLALRSSGVRGLELGHPCRINVEADENCAVLFGLSAGQFPKTVEGFSELVHPDDRERVQQGVGASVERGAEYRTEFRVVWPDGNIRFLAARGKVYRAADGQPLPVHRSHLGRDGTPGSGGEPSAPPPKCS